MSDEGFVTVSVRLPKSHVAKLDSMVRPGQVRSDLLRQAIAYYLEERKQI